MPALLCRLLIFALGLAFSLCLHAQSSDKVVELKGQDTIDLLPYLSYWAPDQPINFATASAPSSHSNYKPFVDNHIYASGRDVWFRFQLKPDNKMAYRGILDMGDILFEEVEVFTQTPQGVTQTIAGLIYPYAERELGNRFIAMPILAPGDAVSTVFLRVKILTGIQLAISPSLAGDSAFYTTASSGMATTSAVAGAMGMVLFFMFLVASLILPGRILFIFLAFASAVFLLNIGHMGFISKWFDLPLQFYRFLFVMMPVMMNILSLYFCRYLFEMPSTFPRLNKLITPFSLLYFLLALPMSALPSDMITPAMVVIKSVINGFASLILLIFGIAALQSKIKGASYYLLGLFLFVAIVNTTRFASLGFTALNADSRTLISIAALALMICFAVAALQKIRLIAEREKILEKQSAVLENQNRVRTDFLISMSHEIRTPINGVLGMAQMLEKTKLDNGQRYYLDILSSAGRTLLNVINEILDISKLEAGKLEVESIYFNIDQTVNYTAEMFGQINRKSGVHFHYESDFNLPVHVIGDPARLQQILNNLLSNAFKFTENGQVTLSVKLVDQISADRAIFRFEVSDSGIGITEDALMRLFNPFEQADATTARRFGGTGLGLAICKKIVELMGGHIHAASKVGEGSRFWADIPFNISQREESRYLNMTKAIAGKTIGMVVQFPEFNQLYISTLKYWGATVQIINPDKLSDIENWSAIDVLYISDMLPMPLLIGWINAARQNHCNILLADGYGENYRPSDIPESDDLRRLLQPMSKSRLAEMLYKIIHRVALTSAESSTSSISRNIIDLQLLVAEDNDVNTKVLQALFAKHAITAEFVVNGQDAVQRYCAQPNRYDAILMDCEMPTMDGFEATSKIRQFESENRCKPVTIIALTAHALLETRDACMACGMNDILTKPVNFPALLSRLEQLANDA